SSPCFLMMPAISGRNARALSCNCWAKAKSFSGNEISDWAADAVMEKVSRCVMKGVPCPDTDATITHANAPIQRRHGVAKRGFDEADMLPHRERAGDDPPRAGGSRLDG